MSASQSTLSTIVSRLFIVCALPLAIAACGGGDSDPAPDTGGGGTGNTGNTGNTGDTGNTGGTGDTTTTGRASECFNPALRAPGTTYRWDLQGSSRGFTATISNQGTIHAGGSFAGHTGLLKDERVSTVTAQGVHLVQNVEDFSSVREDADGPVILQYGLTAESDTQGMRMSHQVVISPPAEVREFTLRPGQSYQYSESSTITMTAAGIQIPTTTDIVTHTVTYEGQETVTVPAGTFTACKFHLQMPDGEGHTYYAKGSGLPLVIMGVDDEGHPMRLEMLSSSHINGMPIDQYHASR